MSFRMFVNVLMLKLAYLHVTSTEPEVFCSTVLGKTSCSVKDVLTIGTKLITLPTAALKKIK